MNFFFITDLVDIWVPESAFPTTASLGLLAFQFPIWSALNQCWFDVSFWFLANYLEFLCRSFLMDCFQVLPIISSWSSYDEILIDQSFKQFFIRLHSPWATTLIPDVIPRIFLLNILKFLSKDLLIPSQFSQGYIRSLIIQDFREILKIDLK